VIKVERPGSGDFARHYDSIVGGLSAYFVWLNVGKRSVELNLKTSGGTAALSTLVGTADVFVHNLGPGAVARMGLGRDAVRRAYPGLITCEISGYGSSGPFADRKAFDLLLQGEAGVLAVTGTPDQAAKVGFSVADIAAGMYALSATLAALYARQRDGVGYIEISMLECLTEWMMVPLYHQMYGGSAPPRTGMHHNLIAPYGPYRTREGGLVNIAVQNDAQWAKLCTGVLQRPDLVSDQRFSSNEQRVLHRSGLERILAPLFARHSAADLQLLLTAADVPFGNVNSLSEVLGHEQLAWRHRWLEVGTEAGPIKALAHPMNISGLPVQVGRLPRRGEDTVAVLGTLESENAAAPRSAGTSRSKAK
jgi:itaconate CoA-transferase